MGVGNANHAHLGWGPVEERVLEYGSGCRCNLFVIGTGLVTWGTGFLE